MGQLITITGGEADLSEHARRAFRHIASSVSVVAVEHENRSMGITVSTLIAVSLAPPTILISVRSASRFLMALTTGSCFTANILSVDQIDMAAECAAAYDPERAHIERFDRTPDGTPMLPESLVCMECCVTDLIPVHTHTLILGEIISLRFQSEGGSPLLYYQGAYRRIDFGSDV